MQQVGEVRCVLARNVVQMYLEELSNKNMSGNNENGQYEDAVMKKFLKHV